MCVCVCVCVSVSVCVCLCVCLCVCVLSECSDAVCCPSTDDHSRVVLALQDNTPGSDYVNASYVDVSSLSLPPPSSSSSSLSLSLSPPSFLPHFSLMNIFTSSPLTFVLPRASTVPTPTSRPRDPSRLPSLTSGG